MPPPPPMWHEEDDDEVAAAFARYNRNGDGMLDLSEIAMLLEDADYEVDAAYVNGIGEMFGRWDSDGSGGVELGEFRKLWADLQLGELLQRSGKLHGSAGSQAAGAPPPPVDDEVAAAFNRFNLNGDDKLDEVEIQRMLETANYDVDRNYVQGLAQLLGDFDADGSGGIELAEFQVLWKQLDLKPRLAAADRKMRMAFDKYNTNGDGMLDKPEIEAMLRSVNYAFDSDYIEGLAQLFGRFDVDGSGGIELAEFRDMWDQLGLGKYMDDEEGTGFSRDDRQEEVDRYYNSKQWFLEVRLSVCLYPSTLCPDASACARERRHAYLVSCLLGAGTGATVRYTCSKSTSADGASCRVKGSTSCGGS